MFLPVTIGSRFTELQVEVVVGLGVLFVLAFGNGANDAGKSVASLMTDPETAGFRPSYRALFWGGVFSGLGSLSAIIISGNLFAVFEPQRFFQTVPGYSFILAAVLGAALWILSGTILRFSVSTTHAIIGAILVQAAFLFGVSNLDWDFLVWRVLLPLAAGPFVALVGVYLLDIIAHRRQGRQGQGPPRIGLAHWGSAAASAYARGVNDAPKMAALGVFLLFGAAQDTRLLSYLVVGAAVVVGSLVWGDRVAKTLVGRSVPVDKGQRLRADATAAALLSAGAYFGDAFSATQVSATAGAGKRGRQVLRSALRGMGLAWGVTLPMAGVMAVVASLVVAAFFT
jgi:PiT family inorganic phosphate transporter